MKHKGNDQFWAEVDAGTWEPETFRTLDKFCKPKKHFIDIGAWNGVCSLYASELGSICHAIEPDREAYKLLTKNIELNLANVTPHNICISDVNGKVSLNTQYENGFGNSMSSIVDRGIIEGVQECKSFTLDSFFALNGIPIQDVCLIKIDIEGGEIRLITQAKEFLAKYKPTVYISLHPAWFPNGDEDTIQIANVIFSIYRVFDTINREYKTDQFLEAVNSGVHSFILTV
jgi:FkbM family methyltransferase